jgi:dolichol-phosphate mannosyltransferase
MSDIATKPLTSTTSPPSAAPAAADVLVSTLVWVHNDREVLPEFLDELENVLRTHYRYYEIVFVDNHSEDGSQEFLLEATRKRPCLRLLRLSRPATQDIAYAAGMEHAIGDFVILMDPYLDRPDDVPRMVATAQEGYDVVIAQREMAPGSGPVRRFMFRLASQMLGERIEPDQTYFRLFHRRVVTALTKIKHRRRYLKYLNALVGYRQRTITTVPHERSARKVRSRGFFRSARVAIDLVISHSATPLRWVAGLGVIASGLNLAYLLYVLVVVLVKQKLAEGWLTTSVMIGSMFFMLFLMLTILAEYIARILEEVQERPLYFIELEAESTVSSRRPEQSLNVV